MFSKTLLLLGILILMLKMALAILIYKSFVLNFTIVIWKHLYHLVTVMILTLFIVIVGMSILLLMILLFLRIIA